MDKNIIRIPVFSVDEVHGVWLHYSPLPRRHPFDLLFDQMVLEKWPKAEVSGIGGHCFQIDLANLDLTDGAYEYVFVMMVINRENNQRETHIVPDPYATQLTRYAGTRGVFHISGGRRVPPGLDMSREDDWRDLPQNEQLVIYELPMRWVDAAEEGYARQVGLGTFDKALYEHLKRWREDLGINAIELTPVQDSPDTLNWGYGTRFFLAPDFDMGGPYELKMFIRECHRLGIRVILDVVMNHSSVNCPLVKLAYDLFYLRNPGDKYFLEENGKDKNEREKRSDWGGKVFRYAHPIDNVYWSRDFHYGMAKYWIEEYHIDGFRIDEFKGIENWDFIREFTEKAHTVNRQSFPGRPFLVIAEDSWRRAQTTDKERPGGRVVDAIWDFDFQEGLRRLITNTWHTEWQKPPDGRRELVKHLLWGDMIWNSGEGKYRDYGFKHPYKQRVIYPTSHDVEGRHEQRLWGFLLEKAAEASEDYSISGIERIPVALEMQVAAFALTLTAQGIPMFLAGEEFAEAHDIPHWDWRLKMSDVVDWYRRDQPGHRDVLRRVSELVRLRTTAACLQQPGLEFFSMDNGFHFTFNENDGERVFAFYRSGGREGFRAGQVIVVANCKAKKYDNFILDWPWGSLRLEEVGGKRQLLPDINSGRASLALDKFQVRVFRT